MARYSDFEASAYVSNRKQSWLDHTDARGATQGGVSRSALQWGCRGQRKRSVADARL